MGILFAGWLEGGNEVANLNAAYGKEEDMLLEAVWDFIVEARKTFEVLSCRS